MIFFYYLCFFFEKKYHMKISINSLKNDEAVIIPLAKAYRSSYNKLSEGYKSEEEMALYTYDYFYHKLKRFAKENESSSLSRTFVVNVDHEPVGFVRYSRIPEYYKKNDNGETKEFEHGMMDGYEYAWYRKVKFVDSVKLDDSTMILNQIYLDPRIQRHGLGTYILAQTLPKMKEKGVKNLILEYNADNKNAEKFYHYFGFRALADTQDLDHIIKDRNGKTRFCVSNVKMVHVPVEVAMERANAKMESNRQKLLQPVANVIVGVVKNVGRNQ